MTNLGDKIGGFFSDLGDKLGSWFDKLGEKLKEIGEFIIDIPGNIIDLLEKLLKKLFIPDEGFFDSQVQEVRQKFAFADSIIGTAENVYSAMTGNTPASLSSGGGSSFGADDSGSGGGSSFDGDVPVFTFDFSKVDTHWNYGGKAVKVSLAWLEPYRDIIQDIIRVFVWVVFVINTYRDLPNIINGVGPAVKVTAEGGDNSDN